MTNDLNRPVRGANTPHPSGSHLPCTKLGWMWGWDTSLHCCLPDGAMKREACSSLQVTRAWVTWQKDCSHFLTFPASEIACGMIWVLLSKLSFASEKPHSADGLDGWRVVGRRGGHWGVTPGPEPAWPDPHNFLEPAMWGMDVHFSGKEPHQHSGRLSYKLGQVLGPKARKQNQAAQRTKAMHTSK